MIEANRKSFDLVTGQRAHDAGDDARIYAAAQHRSYWHIGHHALFDCAMHMLFNAAKVLFDRAFFGWAKGIIPVALFAYLAILVKQPVPRQHFIDIGEKRGWCRYIA